MNKIIFFAFLLAMQLISCRTSEIITMTNQNGGVDTVQNIIVTITNLDSGTIISDGVYDVMKTYIYQTEIDGDTIPLIMWKINLANSNQKYLLGFGLEYGEIDTSLTQSNPKCFRYGLSTINNPNHHNPYVVKEGGEISHIFDVSGKKYMRYAPVGTNNSNGSNTFISILKTADSYTAQTPIVFYDFQSWNTPLKVWGEGSDDLDKPTLLQPTSLSTQTLTYYKYVIIGETTQKMNDYNGVERGNIRIQYSLNVWLPTNLQKPQ